MSIAHTCAVQTIYETSATLSVLPYVVGCLRTRSADWIEFAKCDGASDKNKGRIVIPMETLRNLAGKATRYEVLPAPSTHAYVQDIACFWEGGSGGGCGGCCPATSNISHTPKSTGTAMACKQCVAQGLLCIQHCTRASEGITRAALRKSTIRSNLLCILAALFLFHTR